MSIQVSFDTTGRRLTDKSAVNYEFVRIGFKKTENENRPTEAQGSESVETTSRLAQSLNRKIDYHIQHENNRVIIQVRDGETGEVIRQIPEEEFVRLADRISEFNKKMVDEVA